MTSSERHQLRYERRKAKREQKKLEKYQEICDFDNVFSFDNLYQAGKKCQKGVLWKASTQRYNMNMILNTYKQYKSLRNGTFKHGKFMQFDINERGKTRHIRATNITERVVQKCLCDNCLVPVYSASFIYDNSASLKGKGMDFALKRFKLQLQEQYRKSGCNGYVVFYDFHDFFNLAPHEPLFAESQRRILDERTRKVSDDFIRDFTDCGLGLGSQVSQTNALMLPSPLDHMCKEKLKIKGYGRYMDDGYAMCSSLEEAIYVKQEILKKCAEIGIDINEKKTKIVPMKSKMKFLKTKFKLTKTGKVYLKMNSYSTTHLRQKLRKFKIQIDSAKLTISDVRSSYNSYLGHMKRGNSYLIVEQTNQYFKELFGFYPDKNGWLENV